MKQKKIAIALNLDWPLKRYHELYKGIQDYAQKHTDWLLVWDHFPEQRLKECKSVSYFDGVIGRIKYEAYDEIKRLNIPAVNTWATNSIEDITSVLDDYHAAGAIAADHLIKKGFRNFVHIDFRACTSNSIFHQGFLSVIKSHKCFVKHYQISHKIDTNAALWNKFNKDFKKWTTEWKLPLGIVTSMSSIGPKVTTRCIENGLRIPEDVAVVSLGNDLSYCEGRSPTISSVDINYEKVGYEAARILDMKMRGEKIEQQTFLIKPRGFVARESTDSYAVKDKDIQIALRYICENYQSSISVRDVVESVDISRSTLERRFISLVGHSIFDEINRLRISSVKRLLIETGQDIKSICESSGFSSPHHLRRAFFKDTGLNPAEFKKRHQSS
jgi:LacI family transcriptional regulator